VLALGALLLAAPAPGQCPGDCNRDRVVSIDELVRGVGIALGGPGIEGCDSLDRNGDGTVSVDELVVAVGHALVGCPPHAQAFVATTSFQEGSFAVVDLDAPRDVLPSSPQRRIFRDAVVRTFEGLVYVVNRLFGDNIQVIDPRDGYRSRLQCSTGNGSNPHDIVVVSRHKAYVTLYEQRELLIVNPAARPDCRDFVRGRIDLSPLADADGIPDMDQMVLSGTDLYVSLQRLDINTALRDPAANGALAVIDISTDEVTRSIELTGRNPFAATKGLLVHGGGIWIPQAGQFHLLDGGIERVDLATGAVSGFLVAESDLGGDVTDLVMVSDRLAYAIVSLPGFKTALVSFDPTTGTLRATHYEADGYSLFDIEMNDRGELFLADRSRLGGGLRIFRAADGAALTSAAIDLRLPPFEIVFLP
jgi:hypothetical protein